MEVLKAVGEWLLSIARKLTWLHPVLVAARWLRRKLFELIRDRPWILAIGLVLVLVAGFFNPDWVPECCKPPHKCRYLKLAAGQAFTENGDEIGLGDERNCGDTKLIAFEWFNWMPSYVPAANKTIANLVTSGLHFREDAERSGGHKDSWQEFTVFYAANNFHWLEQATEYADRFKGDSCSIDAIPGEKQRQIRNGLLLRSRQPRSSHLLASEVRTRCNSGRPEDVGRRDRPQFKDCKYELLEIFIPAYEPERLCNERTTYDEWFRPGVKKRVLADNYERLKALARQRWDAKAQSVSSEEWRGLSGKLPKLCMRYIALDGAPFKNQESDWDEFASIAAVWCDH